MTTPLFALLAIMAGASAAGQAAANTALAARIGLAAALLVNSAVVLAATLGLYAVAAGAAPPPGGARFFPPGASFALYLGGLFGWVIIACMPIALPRLGAAHAVALMVLGQGAAALAIDHLGLWGLSRATLTPTRLAGLLLLIAGVALLRR